MGLASPKRPFNITAEPRRTTGGTNVRRLMVATALAVCLGRPAAGQTLASELTRFLYDEAAATVHLRSYLFDRRRQNPPHSVAVAGGGWVGLQTGWFYDVLQLGAVGYTTQPIWAPRGPDETSDGTRLLKLGGYGFFTLGEAYVSARWGNHVATAYRQRIDELEVNPHDNRMLPNTFEAYALRGELGADVQYFAGYVAAIKRRDESSFANMAEVAGAPNVNAGMLLGSVKYGDLTKLRLRGAAYVVPDVLWSSYGDAGGTIALTDSLTLRLQGQVAVQGSTGANSLTRQPSSTFWAGGHANLAWGPWSLQLAFTQVGSAAAWRSPYGIWIGYAKRQVLNFDAAGERAWHIGAGYDFAAIGLPGLTFGASATYGADAVLPGTGRRLSEDWEYDLDLQFRADRLPVPEWLKPLQLRGRVAFVDRYLAQSVNSLTEYRVILNYELTWQGPRRR